MAKSKVRVSPGVFVKSQSQKIIFVTGKGGVGKSMVAAAIALKLSESGNQVVLAELGDQSSYQYVFDLSPGQKPIKTSLGFELSRWSGESCLREYIAYLLPSPKLVRLFFDNSVMKALIQAAPALEELAIVGKITSGIRRVGPTLDYDYIVVDGYSTGHFKALIEAPDGMARAVSFGPMGEQSRSIARVLRDPNFTKVVVTCLPEDLPVQETLELVAYLKETQAIRSVVFLNKVWQTGLSSDELSQLKSNQAPGDEIDFLNYILNEEMAAEKSLRAFAHEDLLVVPMVFRGSSFDLIRALAARIDTRCFKF